MAELRLSFAARADLAAIDDYGAEHFGVAAADAYSRGFSRSFALLRQYPSAGGTDESVGSGLRCMVHRKHRIFYRVENDTVLIVRVLHHAMNAHSALWGH